MLISHETPISLLDISHSYNDYDYALVHLFPKHKEYFEFYLNSRKQGRHVLLDNSIFELGEAYDSDEFAYWVKELEPTEYIIPDALEDRDKTLSNFVEFISKYSDLPGKKIGVVQGKTYEELKHCYISLLGKVDKIAISFDYSFYLKNWNSNILIVPEYLNTQIYPCANKWTKFALGRVQFISQLHAEGLLTYETPLHLLGASVPWEFSLYSVNNLHDYIESIDTSNPIVAGILNKRYIDNKYGLEEKWSVKLADFIETVPDYEQLKNIMFNVCMFKEFVK